MDYWKVEWVSGSVGCFSIRKVELYCYWKMYPKKMLTYSRVMATNHLYFYHREIPRHIYLMR